MRRVQVKSEELFGGRATVYLAEDRRDISAVNFRVSPRRTCARANASRIMRAYDRMLARAARIKRNDSSRMLTSSSACSRGNQPARRCKNVCSSERRARRCSRLIHRVGTRVDSRVGNSRHGEEEARIARAPSPLASPEGAREENRCSLARPRANSVHHRPLSSDFVLQFARAIFFADNRDDLCS